MRRLLQEIRNAPRFPAVLLLCAILYAVFWLAVLSRPAYVPIPKPKGSVVEMLLGFEGVEDGKITVSVFGNSRYPMGALYEETTFLQHVEIVKLPYRPESWSFIRMPMPKDGSDPRTNGRRYYLVQP
jgi:hypothetical protein